MRTRVVGRRKEHAWIPAQASPIAPSLRRRSQSFARTILWVLIAALSWAPAQTQLCQLSITNRLSSGESCIGQETCCRSGLQCYHRTEQEAFCRSVGDCPSDWQCTSVPPGGIVANPSFEANPLQGPLLYFYREEGPSDWDVKSGGDQGETGTEGTVIARNGNAAWGGLNSQDGEYYLVIQRKGYFVEQELSGLTVGAFYKLSFLASSRPINDATMLVTVDSQQLLNQRLPRQFTRYELFFQAGSSDVDLRFENDSPAGEDLSLFLDRVRVQLDHTTTTSLAPTTTTPQPTSSSSSTPAPTTSSSSSAPPTTSSSSPLTSSSAAPTTAAKTSSSSSPSPATSSSLPPSTSSAPPTTSPAPTTALKTSSSSSPVPPSSSSPPTTSSTAAPSTSSTAAPSSSSSPAPTTSSTLPPTTSSSAPASSSSPPSTSSDSTTSIAATPAATSTPTQTASAPTSSSAAPSQSTASSSLPLTNTPAASSSAAASSSSVAVVVSSTTSIAATPAATSTPTQTASAPTSSSAAPSQSTASSSLPLTNTSAAASSAAASSSSVAVVVSTTVEVVQPSSTAAQSTSPPAIATTAVTTSPTSPSPSSAVSDAATSLLALFSSSAPSLSSSSALAAPPATTTQAQTAPGSTSAVAASTPAVDDTGATCCNCARSSCAPASNCKKSGNLELICDSFDCSAFCFPPASSSSARGASSSPLPTTTAPIGPVVTSSGTEGVTSAGTAATSAAAQSTQVAATTGAATTGAATTGAATTGAAIVVSSTSDAAQSTQVAATTQVATTMGATVLSSTTAAAPVTGPGTTTAAVAETSAEADPQGSTSTAAGAVDSTSTTAAAVVGSTSTAAAVVAGSTSTAAAVVVGSTSTAAVIVGSTAAASTSAEATTAAGTATDAAQQSSTTTAAVAETVPGTTSAVVAGTDAATSSGVQTTAAALSCAPGSSSLSTAGATCALCSAGTYKASTGTEGCEPCFADSSSAEGSAGCECDVGFEQTAATSCSSCAAGSFTNTSGSPNCVQCSIGSYQYESQATACLQCPSGSTTAAAGSSLLSECACAQGSGLDCMARTIRSSSAATVQVTSSLRVSASTSEFSAVQTLFLDALAQFLSVATSAVQLVSFSAASGRRALDQSPGLGNLGVGGRALLQSSSSVLADISVDVPEEDVSEVQELLLSSGQSASFSTLLASLALPNVSAVAVGAACGQGKEPQDGACSACALGFYQNLTGDHACVPCPPQATTAAVGSLSEAACKFCVAGSYLLDLASGCAVCEAGFFCPGGRSARIECGQGSSAPAESDSAEDCVCAPGRTGLAGQGGSCLQCQPGSYKSDSGNGACTPCESRTYSTATGATTADTCDTCPPNSDSPAGSSSLEACVCMAGFEPDGTGACVEIGAGEVFVASMSPSNCDLFGGSVVSFNLQIVAHDADESAGSPLDLTGMDVQWVRFKPDAEPVALTITNAEAGAIVAVCPAVVGVGRGRGQLLDSALELVAEFPFEYIAPPARVSPPLIPATGGVVTVRIFGASAGAFTEDGCQIVVGGTPVEAISVTLGSQGSGPGYIDVEVEIAAWSTMSEQPEDEEDEGGDEEAGAACCDCERNSCNTNGQNGNCNQNGNLGAQCDALDCNSFCAGARRSRAVAGARGEGGGKPTRRAGEEEEPRPVPLSSTCSGSLQASVLHVKLPTLVRVDIDEEGGVCYTDGCAIMMVIADPPETAQTEDDWVLTISGVEPLPIGTVPRLSVMSRSGDQTTLGIELPLVRAAGTATFTLSPTEPLTGFTVESLAVQATVDVNWAPPAVVSIRDTDTPENDAPDFVSAAGGDSLTVEIRGLDPVTDLTSLVVTIDGVVVPVTALLFSDLLSTSFTIAVPAHAPGTAIVSVSVVGSARPSAALEVVYNSDAFTLECVDACSDGQLGGEVIDLQVSGFPAFTGADITVSFGDVVAEGVTVAADVISVRVPPFVGTMTKASETVVVRVQDVRDASAVVLAPFRYLRAPQLVSVVFNAIGSTLIVSLDVPSNAVVGLLACSEVITASSATASADLLGPGAQCRWESDRRFGVVLGSGATIVPGDSVTLLGSELRTLDGVSDASGDLTLAVTAPAAPQAPEVVVDGPNEIGRCDAAALTAEASGSVRDMQFAWRCDNCEGGEALVSHLASHTTETASVPASLLLESREYSISVVATTFLGVRTQRTATKLRVLRLPPPVISITMPPGPYRRSRRLYFSSKAELSACSSSSAPVSFQWFVASDSTDTAQSEIVLAVSGPNLDIPANTLETGVAYTISLVGTQAGASTATATRTLVIEPSPIAVRVSGGAQRTIGRASQGVTVDASNSLDPDTCVPGGNASDCQDGLKYAWVCQLPNGSPCRSRTDQSVLVFASSSSLDVDVNSIALGQFDNVVMVLTVTKGKRFSSSEVVINVSEDDVVVDTLLDWTGERARYHPQGILVNGASSRVVFTSKTDVANADYSWTLAGPGLNAGGSLSPSAGFPAGSSGAEFVVNMGGILGIVPGTRYQVTLETRADGNSGSVSMTIITNQPPSGGTCRLNSAVGRSLLDEFRVECSGWTAESPPLQYQQGIATVGAASTSALTWSAPSYSKSASVRLVTGSYRLVVRVVDDLGTYTDSPPMPLQVEEADLRLNNSGLDASPEDGVEMVIDFLDSLGNVNQLLFCVESIADSLELDADGGARRGGWRRLLASSAAYRMRVRRMLLRKMDGGSASDSVSDVTGPALLSSTSKLQPGPDEVFPRAPNEDSMALLDASTKALRIEQLRDGGLLQALTLVDKLLASSEQMETMDQGEVVVSGSLASLQVIANAIAQPMLIAEQPLVEQAGGSWISVRKVEESKSTELLTRSGGNITVSTPAQTGQVGMLAMELGHMWGLQRWDEETGLSVLSQPLIAGAIVLDGQTDIRRDIDQDSMHITATLPIQTRGFSAEERTMIAQGVGIECRVWHSGSRNWDRSSCYRRAVDLDPNFPNGTVTCQCNLDGAYTVVLQTQKLADSLRGPVAKTAHSRYHSSGFTWAAFTFAIVMATMIAGFFFVTFSVFQNEFPRYWKNEHVELYCVKLGEVVTQQTLGLWFEQGELDTDKIARIETRKKFSEQKQWTESFNRLARVKNKANAHDITGCDWIMILCANRAYRNGFMEHQMDKIEDHIMANDNFVEHARRMRYVQQKATGIVNEQGLWWSELRDGALNEMNFDETVYPHGYFPSDLGLQARLRARNQQLPQQQQRQLVPSGGFGNQLSVQPPLVMGGNLAFPMPGANLVYQAPNAARSRFNDSAGPAPGINLLNGMSNGAAVVSPSNASSHFPSPQPSVSIPINNLTARFSSMPPMAPPQPPQFQSVPGFPMPGMPPPFGMVYPNGSMPGMGMNGSAPPSLNDMMGQPNGINGAYFNGGGQMPMFGGGMSHGVPPGLGARYLGAPGNGFGYNFI